MSLALTSQPVEQDGADVLVIYHASCHDGFCCAWLLHKIYPDAQFMAFHHGDVIDSVSGLHVVVADFSFSRAETERLIEESKSFLCLDHHRTAAERLSGLPGCFFDAEKSGGRMVWDYFRDHLRSSVTNRSESHWLVDYTEDRDLWRWQLPASRQVSAALRMFEFDFDVWDSLVMIQSETAAVISSGEKAINGTTLVGYFNQRAESIVGHAKEICLPVSDDDYLIVPAANVTDPNVISDAGHLLADSHESKIGLTYFFDGHGFRFSIRSIGDVDAGRIAEFNGGGGHKNAAGFYRDSFPDVFYPEFEVKQ